ncbi:MAG: chromosomal replication initiator protein DnaA [Oligoflexia bacterium]|nr:MAG: chromosomal replication initiator protein DnaA [Oligoflexia bacterium]
MELNLSFWGIIKDRIKQRNPGNKFLENFLDPVTYVDTLGTADVPRIILSVPSNIHQYFIIENFLNQIYEEISAIYKGPFEVDITVNSGAGASENQSSLPHDYVAYSENQYQAPKNQIGFQAQVVPSQTDKRREILNSEYTFSTFVVGRNNEFAHAACYNVAQNPGSGYNPLFICGPSGMGKTHLLHAVGNEIKNRFPTLRITYMSAESFLNECIAAMRKHNMDKFRQQYRDNSDILLVDDVQYIGKGEATQEEFFHMINSFIEKKKQIILASDRMPKDIINLEDRNRSRLEWGLIADIQMPEFETRVAILRYKAEKFHVRLSDEVINYIARISKKSIRELEGNLKKVKMFSELQGLSIDIELARRVLATHETTTSITIEDIQKLVADHFKVRVLDLKSTTRAKQIVIPRQISMYLIKKHLDKSLVDIGRAFGGKDHTTVMNSLERVQFLQNTDGDIKNDIEELTTRIHNITGV